MSRNIRSILFFVTRVTCYTYMLMKGFHSGDDGPTHREQGSLECDIHIHTLDEDLRGVPFVCGTV